METNPSINVVSETSPLLENKWIRPHKKYNHVNGLLLTHYFKEFSNLLKSLEGVSPPPLTRRLVVRVHNITFLFGALLGLTNAVWSPTALYYKYDKIVGEANLDLYGVICGKIVDSNFSAPAGWTDHFWNEFVNFFFNNVDRPYLLGQFLSVSDGSLPIMDCADYDQPCSLQLQFPVAWTKFILLFSLVLSVNQIVSLTIVPVLKAVWPGSLLTEDQRNSMKNQVKFYAEFLKHDNFDFKLSRKKYYPTHLDWKLYEELPSELQKEITLFAISEVVPTKRRIHFAYRKCQKILREDSSHNFRKFLARAIALTFVASQVILLTKFTQFFEDLFEETDFYDHTVARFINKNHCSDLPCQLYGGVSCGTGSAGCFVTGDLPMINFSQLQITSLVLEDYARVSSYVGFGLSLIPVAFLALISVAERAANWVNRIWKK